MAFNMCFLHDYNCRSFLFRSYRRYSWWVQSDVNDEGTLIDIEWNNGGTHALAIFLDLEEEIKF